MNYTVQPHDTLGNIAAHHGVTVEALMLANGITNPHLIHVGQTLIIPVPHHHHHYPISHHPAHHLPMHDHHHLHHRFHHLETRIQHLEHRINRLEQGHHHHH